MKRVPVLLLLAVLSIPTLTGCSTIVATPISSEVSGDIRSEKVVSYAIGKPAQVYVGEPMVIRKTYFYRHGRDAYKADNDFVISGGLLDAKVQAIGQAGVPYPVKGKVPFKGGQIDAIEISGGAAHRFIYGITQDGRFSGVVAGWTWGTSPVAGVNQYQIAPVGTLFTLDLSSRTVLENHPYENFEILYSGTSAGSMRLLYREYTRRDLIRPGFTQELTYPADAKQIRFKGMLIEILSIHADSIDFRVIEDGKPKSA